MQHLYHSLRRSFLLLLPLWIASLSLSAQETAEPFSVNLIKQRADSAYQKAAYTEAISLYKQILQRGESPTVYYNLGNAYYRMDSMAQAILNYERAYLLAPQNKDIETNLNIAYSKTVDQVTPNFQDSFLTAIISFVNIYSWPYWAIVCSCLAIVCLAGYFWFPSIRIRRYLGLLSLLLCTACITSNILIYNKKTNQEERKEAIVMQQKTQVRSTPSADGEISFSVHAGRKVIIIDDTMKEWKEVLVENGATGWIKANAIEIIQNRDLE